MERLTMSRSFMIVGAKSGMIIIEAMCVGTFSAYLCILNPTETWDNELETKHQQQRLLRTGAVDTRSHHFRCADTIAYAQQ